MALLNKKSEKEEEHKGLGGSARSSELRAKIEKEKAKLTYQKKREEFDAKIEDLAQKAADFYEEYGEEDWRTELLVGFLDMAVQLQDIIKVVTAFSQVTEIISTAFGVLNQSLELSMGSMMEIGSPTQSSLKMWWTRQKAMRNMRKQTTQMVQQMKWCLSMAGQTTEAFEKMSYSISRSMAKMNGRRAKRKEKNAAKAGPGTAAPEGKGMDKVKGILRDRGTTPPTTPTAPTAPTAPTGGSAPAGDSGIDDLT